MDVRFGYTVQLVADDYVAVCGCGWRSQATLTAGIAGTLWDRHDVVHHRTLVDVDLTTVDWDAELRSIV